mmetsp:Transcript_32990/g.77112  ORF Transcript_32990/g.77112 Transcript_32990/m.77112 type:complete len:256 (+) Transcript_32990:217-984(+)
METSWTATPVRSTTVVLPSIPRRSKGILPSSPAIASSTPSSATPFSRTFPSATAWTHSPNSRHCALESHTTQAPLKTFGPSSLLPLQSAPKAITTAPFFTSMRRGVSEGVDVTITSHSRTSAASPTTVTLCHPLASILALNVPDVILLRDQTSSFASGKSLRIISPVSDPTHPAPTKPIVCTLLGASALAHTHAAALVLMSVSSPPSARTACNSPVVWLKTSMHPCELLTAPFVFVWLLGHPEATLTTKNSSPRT